MLAAGPSGNFDGTSEDEVVPGDGDGHEAGVAPAVRAAL